MICASADLWKVDPRAFFLRLLLQVSSEPSEKSSRTFVDRHEGSVAANWAAGLRVSPSLSYIEVTIDKA